MSKVTVVGAGNVGATCANVLAVNEVASEVVLIDIKEGLAEGKAMDIMQTAQLMGFDSVVTGVTNDYSKTAGSDVVIITSGIPRKPGMTREELIGVNAGIVKSVAENILKHSPNAILIIVSNPMDTMAYLSYKVLGLPRERVIGMGGALDSSRFKYFLSQALGCNANEVEGIVIGGHGDTTMIPLARLATYSCIEAFERRQTQRSSEKHYGGRSHTHGAARDIGLDGSGSRSIVCCRKHRKRPEEDDNLIRIPQRRIWYERPQYRSTCRDRQKRHRKDCRTRPYRRRESQVRGFGRSGT